MKLFRTRPLTLVCLQKMPGHHMSEANVVPQAGLEPALLSKQDFESGTKYLNSLIVISFLQRMCASVLIDVLIYDWIFTSNSTL